MMSARLLRAAGGGHDVAKSRRGFYRLIDVSYAWMLRHSMRWRLLVAVLAIAVMISSVPLYRMVKQGFLPSDADEGEFSIMVTAPEGTSIPLMDEYMRDVEDEVRSVYGVQTILTTVGAGFLGGVNNGNIHVGLIPHEERIFSLERLFMGLIHRDPKAAFRGNVSQTGVVQDIRRRLQKLDKLRCQLRNYASIPLGGGGNFDIDFIIRGPELEKLYEYAERLRLRSAEIGGIADADTTLRLDKPELRVVPDRSRAADLGVDMSDVGNALRLMVGGEKQVSLFHDSNLNEDYDVDLRLEEGARNDPTAIPNLYLPRRNGELVQLSNVARLQLVPAPSRIDRIDKQRTVSLRGGVAPGYALADRLAALRQAADELNMPVEYTTRVAGKGRELERTFGEFLWAFLLSVIFMYMILACNYESLIHPLTILLSLPLTVPFALFSLWYTGGTLNLYSALGILVLFGVVKKNAILQIDHMNNLRRQGMPRLEAIIQANRDRLRPILMTTFALVAGMLPLAVGTGPGAEERRAVAIVVIGGQTLSLLLTLLVTPVVYSYFDDIGSLFVGRRRRRTIELVEAIEAGSPADEPLPADIMRS
jgi:HAE1 family hydrophobic/amphiphilic exporter-1